MWASWGRDEVNGEYGRCCRGQEGCCERRSAKIIPSGNKSVLYSNMVKGESILKRKAKELGA